MAIPISLRDVHCALRPHVGTRLLAGDMLSIGVTNLLQGYSPYRETLEDVHDRLLTYLASALERMTGGTMVVLLDDYREQRLGENELSWMADSVMGVLFESLTPFSANFVKLNDYSLHMQSLSVLRVLYLNYAQFFTDEEYLFLTNTIKRIYPPQAYCDWLRA